MGGKVKKGSKSLPIVFWKPLFRDDEGKVVPEESTQDREDLKKSFVLRYYRVFNISDVEGVNFKLPEEMESEEGVGTSAMITIPAYRVLGQHTDSESIQIVEGNLKKNIAHEV